MSARKRRRSSKQCAFSPLIWRGIEVSETTTRSALKRAIEEAHEVESERVPSRREPGRERLAAVNEIGETSNGRCSTAISMLGDGRLRLEEKWAWESKPGTGTSAAEEIV